MSNIDLIGMSNRDLIGMSNSELLTVEPLDLQFPFELKKQISCSLYLTNKTDNNVAFKVKTTNPKKYCVRPNTGVVLPRSTCEVLVTMQAQKEAPSDMQCKDKFLLQGVIASPGVTAKEVTPEMFSKEAGHRVEETKLRVTYVAPPRPPSPVHEGSEEGSSPRASVSDNGHGSEFSIFMFNFSLRDLSWTTRLDIKKTHLRYFSQFFQVCHRQNHVTSSFAFALFKTDFWR
ncbi:vesicle associated protein [Arabidopsis thaliana]|uniref:Isoform 2 of Vesicle-associated protein 1-1 n=1 Tax=Arabidopsis thaliana TaxID=3702 RepID=Q8VZ95-2|nr:vesicle associated protein [Arabidopsis thaliana]AEE80088.1 vesicle associated protein [Arabidopsis thaliana]|eukprot:NP_001030904.1 vesicle associated protein [Arabidopsis thaliana]